MYYVKTNCSFLIKKKKRFYEDLKAKNKKESWEDWGWKLNNKQ